MAGLTYNSYSEKSIVVREEKTGTYTSELDKLGGLFNARLKGGAGWIFPKKKEGDILNLIKTLKQTEKINPILKEDKDLFSEIKKQAVKMTDSEKLFFISKIVSILNETVSVPVSVPINKPVSYQKVSQKADSDGDKEDVSDSDIDSDDEPTVPRKRFL